MMIALRNLLLLFCFAGMLCAWLGIELDVSVLFMCVAALAGAYGLKYLVNKLPDD